MEATPRPPVRHKRTSANLFRITMNRFLNRKRAEEGLALNTDALNTLSSPSPLSPNLKKSATSRWKKNKKQPEPKPELNIKAALPETDDFRTSLLMPNLSARFSMLREQDDPNSKLGKASDDSVLQPRRRSRMLDFGFGNGLGDIAEVQSINSSVRPPFASSGRQVSYGSEDGYGSETDSTRGVMARARPGEGNNLFGGRQKVYLIPKGVANSSMSLGKAVYEDDVGVSAFQKHKQRERELQRERERELQEERPSYEAAQSFDFGLRQADAGGENDRQGSATPNDSAKDLSHSPSLSSYDKKRSTTSSTGRSEARSSTAATSITSQPAATAPLPSSTHPPPGPPPAVPSLERSHTRARRLYEQGLDQHIQEQQTSALTRLNSIQRQRTLNSGKSAPPFLHTARSAGNLHEKMPQNVYASRAQSPPPSAPSASLTTFNPIRKPHSGTVSPNGSGIGSGPQSPLSPPLSDLDEASVMYQALEPGDRGKATAMGAFNKPAQAFDEKQYLERQQMLQRSNSSTVIKQQLPGTTAPQQRVGRFEQERDQSGSNASSRSRSGSTSKQQEVATKAFSVFQIAANRIQKSGSQPQQSDNRYVPDAHRTFFGNISASDSEEDGEETPRTAQGFGHGARAYGQPDFGYGAPPGRWQPTVLPSVSEHPALRFQKSKPTVLEEEQEEEESLPQPLKPAASPLSIHTNAVQATAKQDEVVDLPTLGAGDAPLNGMMHHLRQKSNQSSIYPNDEQMAEDVPDLPRMPLEPKNLGLTHRPMRSTIDSESRVASTYTSSNPWDLDDVDNGQYEGEGVDRHSVSPIEGGRSQSRFGSSRAPSRTATLPDRQSDVSSAQESETGSWQHELRRRHTRDASTATQQERAAFDSELAARRAAIQDNIKSIVETDHSRNVSPAPSVGGAFKAFGMLRSKSSRDSFDSRQNPGQTSAKASKILGIGGGSNNASSVTLNSPYERSAYSFDAPGRPRGNSVSRPPLTSNAPRALQQSEQDARREREQSRARAGSDAGRPERPPQTGRTPPNSSVRARSRSNSEAASAGARSHGRTGPYRDDLEKAMMEGTGSSAYGQPELSPLVPRELTPRPSPDILQSQFGQRERARSNSRGGMTNHFDSKTMPQLQTAQNARLAPAPTGPSPITLSPNIYTPVTSSRSTPAVSPYTQTAPPPFAAATPPLSGASTPVGSSFSTPPPGIHSAPGGPRASGPLRKKTISKSDISEPVKLVSSTSKIDTVDLPKGASLKNGMDNPPPLPPINPLRRGTRKIFAFGRGEDSREAGDDGHDFGRSRTPDPWMSKAPTPDLPLDSVRSARGPMARKVGSPQKPWESSPAPHAGYGYGSGAVSPERVERSPPAQQQQQHQQVVGMEGGMF